MVVKQCAAHKGSVVSSGTVRDDGQTRRSRRRRVALLTGRVDGSNELTTCTINRYMNRVPRGTVVGSYDTSCIGIVQRYGGSWQQGSTLTDRHRRDRIDASREGPAPPCQASRHIRGAAAGATAQRQKPAGCGVRYCCECPDGLVWREGALVRCGTEWWRCRSGAAFAERDTSVSRSVGGPATSRRPVAPCCHNQAP